MRRGLAKGDLPALVMAILGRQPLHGYGIAQEVKRLSDDALTMKESTLYPALRALEQDGLIVGAWETQEKGPDRKIYTLTEAGVKEAQRRTQEMKDYTLLIHTVLGRIGHAQSA